MMKKLLVFFIIIITLSILVLKYAYPRNEDGIMHRLRILLFDENPVKVICEDGIITDDVSITWSADFVSEKTIWSYNTHHTRIGNEYGSQGFNIYLNDSKFCRVNHMKTNNWHTHRYTFKIYKNVLGDTLVDFTVEGPNALSINEITP